MMTPNETYRRLPGRARRHFGMLTRKRCYLWLASDHVLNVEAAGYAESCKRFYFKDIQALVVCKTDAGRDASIVLVFLTGLFGLLSAVATASWGPWGALAFIVPGLLAALLALNALLGPTCMTRLHTDVQVERLASLGRLRTAMRTVALLKPLIESAQGRLTPEDLEAEIEEAVAVTASVHAAASPVAAAAVSGQPQYVSGNIHAALFGVFLLDAPSCFLELFYQGAWTRLLFLPLWPGTIVLLVVALIKQGHSTLPRTIKDTAWVACGVVILNTVFGMGYGIVRGLGDPEMFVGHVALGTQFEGPVFTGYCIFVGTAELILGLLGLMMLQRYRAARRVLETAPAEPPAPEQKEV